MKKTDAEFKERCKLIRERYKLIYNPALDKQDTKPSAKTLRAEENIRRYGLPKEFYESQHRIQE